MNLLIRFIPELSLLFVAMIWGASYSTAKGALIYVDVLLFLFIRFFITLVLMLPFSIHKLKSLSLKDVTKGIILGAILASIFAAETFGVFYTSATNAAFLISLCIVFTPILDSALSLKFPSWIVLLGAALSCAGTALMTGGSFALSFGDALILAAAGLRAVMVIATKRLMRDSAMRSLDLTTLQIMVVAVAMGVVLLAQRDMDGIRLPVAYEFWAAMLFLSLFCTVAAFFIQNAAVRLLNPTRVSFLMGTEPIFGAAFAVWLLSENPGAYGMFGALLILLGTFIGIRAESQAPFSFRSATRSMPGPPVREQA